MQRLFVLFFVFTSAAAAASAQNGAPAAADTAQGPVFRSGAELVALSVAVVDPSQNFVRGLSAGDFAIYEDGIRQDVSFFAATDIPLDLVLLLDTSASMTDKLHTVHDAALGFLRTLRPGDRASVIAFNDTVEVMQELTSEPGRLEAAVRGTEPRGATALHNAIYVALKEFGRTARKAGEVRRQAIAVLSDGEDTCSLMTFDDVLGEAKKSTVNIYTIALRTKAGTQQQRGTFSTAGYSMKALARETGAQSFFPGSVQELKGVYARIADDLDHQYAIGYSPKNLRADGRFRRVVVQVVSRPELRLRTRTGYVAERATPSALPTVATSASAAVPKP